MYMPPHFDSKDPEIAAELMRDYAFASLISNDDDGLPYVSHLPLHAERGGESFTIWGHCAKPNPHWRYLQARPRALAVFMGPHAYMSPKVYPDLARVPTWNYLAVHCAVEARLIEDDSGKDGLLKKLIADNEPSYAQQWIDLGEEYQRKMLAGIVGFELRVTSWQCKLKLNQHRKEAHGAMRKAYASGDADARVLAQWMDRLGLGG
ncbi:MAG TPA: FMN-binding negative transcriptional regulator [Ramlibacter sp.]|nr:FMN-binding negative transcriptional regulator [Ramlibacter sp.]